MVFFCYQQVITLGYRAFNKREDKGRENRLEVNRENIGNNRDVLY